LILPISSPVLAIALDPPNPISLWNMVSNRYYSPLPHRKRTLFSRSVFALAILFLPHRAN
jgi:hypothetical protein